MTRSNKLIAQEKTTMNLRVKAWLALGFHSISLVLLVTGAVSHWDRDPLVAVVFGLAALSAGTRAQAAWDAI
jgi:hypothetical protein